MQPPWSRIVANAEAKALAAQAKKLAAHPAREREPAKKRHKKNLPQPMPENFLAGKPVGSTVTYPTQASMRYKRGQQAALVAQDGLTGTAGVNRLAMYEGTKPR